MRRCGAATWKARLAIPAATLVMLFALRATPARADVEEFSTFDIGPQEHDDESVFDHYLTRFPRAWSDAWEHSTAGLRTSQGCLTSGQWFIDTDLRARAPLGDRAWLGIDYFQSDSDILHTDHLDLSFHFPMPGGAAFAMFRPSPNKTSQDFALGWETGADTSAFQMRATWTLEDVFNEFWSFRQTQVGALSEPYSRRPYEPAIFLAVRNPRWRVEAGGKWLTPSTKRISDVNTLLPISNEDLWGAAGHLGGEASLGALTLEVRTDHRQARRRVEPIDASVTEDLNWRRQWSSEVHLRATVDPRTSVEAWWMYESRFQRRGRPALESQLGVLDRMVGLELLRQVGSRVTARAGGMYERVGVGRTDWPDFSWGTRTESRAYLGLAARFGRVLVSGTEGIELDPEKYDVWLVHDKGFLQLQTTF